MNELHDADYSDQFWARYLIPYARACVRQERYYADSQAEVPIPFLPYLGPEPCTSGVARRTYFYELLRNSRNFLRSLSPSAVRRFETDKICFGVRANVISEACQAEHVILSWAPLFFRKNSNVRARLLKIADRQNDIFYSNVLKFMPSAFVEYHDSFKKKAEALLRQRLPKEIFVDHFETHFQRFVAYLASEQGAILTKIQGGYLLEDSGSIPYAKRLERDRLFTYGWKLSAQDQPFYALRLEEYAKTYRKACRAGKNVDVLVVYNSLDTESRKSMCIESASMLSSYLDRQAYPRVVLRPRGISRYVSSKSNISRLGVPNNLEVDSGMSPLSRLAARSRIVLHLEHPSTNFLECIFVGQPVMVVLGDCKLGGPAKSFCQEFQKLGLWHNDFPSLLQSLNSIDLDSWWNDVVRSESLQAFRETFARSRASFERDQKNHV